MSWRRFVVLLRGLGPNSACATRAQVKRLQEAAGSRRKVVEVGPGEATVSALRSLFGPAPVSPAKPEG